MYSNEILNKSAVSLQKFLSSQINVALLVVFAILVRRYDLVVTPQFWAEDATQWFYQAYFVGGLKPFANFYGGYLQILPQFFTSFTVLFVPLTYVPLILNLIAIGIAAFSLSLFSNANYRWIVKTDWLRGFVCVVFCLANPGPEVIGTITNLHWVLTLAAVLLTLFETESRLTKYLIRFVVVAICFSAPNTIFFVPLVLLAAVLRRGSFVTQLLYCGSIFSHFAIARYVGAGDSGIPHVPFSQLMTAVGDFLHVVVLQSLFGYAGAYYLDSWSWHLSAAIAIVIFIFIFGYLLVASSWGGRVAIAAVGLVFLGSIGSAIYLRQSVLFPYPSKQFLSVPYPSHEFYNHGRYLFLSSFIFFIGLVKFVEALESRKVAGLARSMVLGLASLSSVIGNRSFGPLPDLNWPFYAKRIEAGWAGAVPINPTTWGWFLEVPNIRGIDQSQFPKTLSEIYSDPPSDHINLRVVPIEGKAYQAFFEHAESKVTREVEVSDSKLEFFYGLDPRAYDKSDGVEFVVQLVSNASEPQVLHELFRKKVRPRDVLADRKWQMASIDLSSMVGRKVMIRFTTRTLDDAGYDWALWVNLHFSE